MTFNNRQRLDPSQVEDRRGRRTGRNVAIGGGGLGLIVLIIALILGVNPAELGISTDPQASVSNADPASVSNLAEQCRTGADANASEDCQIVGFVNSIQAFWADEFARRGAQYSPAKLVLFSGSTEAACGYANAAVGPFYCPRDQQIYMDLSFFKELQTRFGAQGGSFAQAYVIAHEYGHHIQNLTGALQGGQRDTGPNSTAVFIELQADCLAGVWANRATETGYLTRISEAEITQSLDAAAAVGDDRIQQATQGYVSPESWTHGSAEQRQRALLDGLRSGDLDTCNSPGWDQ
jgi:uncharacterized protein